MLPELKIMSWFSYSRALGGGSSGGPLISRDTFWMDADGDLILMTLF
jgi:hypothetical protein